MDAPLTPEQRARVDRGLEAMRADAESDWWTRLLDKLSDAPLIDEADLDPPTRRRPGGYRGVPKDEPRALDRHGRYVYGIAPTRREIEVLYLLSVGGTLATAAATLGISFETAKHHLRNVRRRLGAASRPGTVAAAIRHGYML